jgi:hypothetical protein
MRQAMLLNTGFFETSQRTLDAQMRIIAGNWDGAGVSAGTLQYNFAYANRLKELWAHMLNNHDSVVRGVFGANTALYDEFRDVILNRTQADQIAWGGTITDWTKPSPDGHRLIEPWKTILGDLMMTQQNLDKYFSMMDAYYVPNPLDLFKQVSCTSRAALASFFDISVNRGRYYPCITIVNDFEAIDARQDLTDEQKEAEKVKVINNRGNDTTNGITATTWKARRDCMAQLGGSYFGDAYNPETDFDINLEPALPEKVGGVGGFVKLGTMGVSNLYLGSSPVESIFLGANLVGKAEQTPYYTSKVPNTQFRTNPNSYSGFEDGAVTLERGQPLWIDVQNWVACRSYYTTDGSTPTENSARYYDGISFTESCTLKVLNVSLSGVAEPIRTLNITIAAPTYRYVRFVGHGDQTGVTTRLVELEALEGATNRLLGKLPMAGYTPVAGGNIAVATDGAKVHGSGYPFWWSGEGIPDLVYDLGANYKLDTLNVTMYSPTVDPRTSQFKVYVSKDNATWKLVADYSGNTNNQPESGWNFPIV